MHPSRGWSRNLGTIERVMKDIERIRCAQYMWRLRASPRVQGGWGRILSLLCVPANESPGALKDPS